MPMVTLNKAAIGVRAINNSCKLIKINNLDLTGSVIFVRTGGILSGRFMMFVVTNLAL